jgi:hypothetical protein
MLLMAICAVILTAGCTSSNATSNGSADSQTALPWNDLEQQRVLDAMDVRVEQKSGQRVLLDPLTVSTASPFAAVRARLERPNGQAIKMSEVGSQTPSRAGRDAQAIALLKKSGEEWVVLECEIGVTDFPSWQWAEAHGAPEAVFPH